MRSTSIVIIPRPCAKVAPSRRSRCLCRPPMPELPEVEVTRLGFAERIRGARVTAVRLGKPLRWPLGSAPEAIVGQKVGAVSRRGKYLWLALERGGLLMHLGMSGSLAFGRGRGEPGKHDHFDLVTARGTLRLTDPRRFGAIVWSPSLEVGAGRQAARRPRPRALRSGLRRRLPACRLEAPPRRREDGAARRRHRRRRGQHLRLRGALEAGIDPRTRSDRISRPRAARLAEAVRSTLARAVELGGSTLRNYRGARASTARSSSRPRSTGAPARRAFAAARTCGASSRARARLSSARAASVAESAHRFGHAAPQVCERPATRCEEVFRHVSIRGPALR